MSYIADEIRIKYGLSKNPSPALIEKWRKTTNSFIATGHDKENAGYTAAKLTFSDYQTSFYASEAQNIAYLLNALQSGGKK